MFGCLFSLAIKMLLSVFVLLFTNFNDYSSSSDTVFVHVHINIDKDVDCLQSHNSDSPHMI